MVRALADTATIGILQEHALRRGEVLTASTVLRLVSLAPSQDH
ncbi:hypothetical protein [Lentzea guizhouensis]|nr:hypothetical protein [Lentzea guizhouensis]